MCENKTQKFDQQDLIDQVTFWRNFIRELESKNPEDVLPEMREALAASEARLSVMKESNFKRT